MTCRERVNAVADELILVDEGALSLSRTIWTTTPSGSPSVNVVIDENGRAQITSVHRSSGHRLLDIAATGSVIGDWVSDVSNCEREDLPANHLVAVEYRDNEG